MDCEKIVTYNLKPCLALQSMVAAFAMTIM